MQAGLPCRVRPFVSAGKNSGGQMLDVVPAPYCEGRRRSRLLAGNVAAHRARCNRNKALSLTQQLRRPIGNRHADDAASRSDRPGTGRD